MGPIFNENFAGKKGLWVPWTVHGTQWQMSDANVEVNHLYPNAHLTYFYYYLGVSLHFLVLFMGPTILFQLPFSFIYSTISKKF